MQRVFVAALAAFIAVSSPAFATPDLGCALSTRVDDVMTVRALPAALRKLLAPMAELGAPFNKTDVVERGLPSRRLIHAGHRNVTWFVLYEQGGVAYRWHVLVADVSDTDEAKVLVNKWIPVAWRDGGWKAQGNICTQIDDAFAARPQP